MRAVRSVVFVVALACGVVATASVPAPAAPNLSAVHVKKVVYAVGLDHPVAIATRYGDSRLYVAEQTGHVRIVGAGGVLVRRHVLDIPVSYGGERGLLGLAFSPGGTRLYVYYTDVNGDIRLVEYRMNGDVADPHSRRSILGIEHSAHSNHNGGQLMFGPDKRLYIGVGDGGGAGDVANNAQNRNVRLGKILRINPAPNGTHAFTVPTDNPYYGIAGRAGEIWDYGLRNPWKFTFDRTNGTMWIADVGQDAYEEVDRAGPTAKGLNFGWHYREGLHPYNGGARPPGNVDPIFDISHSTGACAIIGGYVYRGHALPALVGAYVYGDACRPQISSAVYSGGVVTQRRDLGIAVSGLSSFGEGSGGELYAASLSGTIYKLVPA